MKNNMKAIAAIMLMTAVIMTACGPEDDPNNNGNNNGGGNNGNTDTKETVDLGLQSGTLWATCNIGASVPEGKGNYYAWGETTPKDTYNWSTYKYRKDGLTKYCNKAVFGDYGFTDDLTILQPDDDAATENWGKGWCMPSKEQFIELYESTSVTYSKMNGVNGLLFTATNGNSLFLPVAGAYEDDDSFGELTLGYYWSSSLDTNDPLDAGHFDFDSNGYGIYHNDHGRRSLGQSVRPVRSAR